ncbi:alpha/beta hydrolase [Oscillospiraceae bacterium LTW-04]|nr:alpha/beta hydrolase [Oscillospiraceae bacterium MB24-C1]
MLTISQNIILNETLQTFQVGAASIHARVVDKKEDGKTAIYIHGGGSGGNHTMLLRPAKWMIEKGLFSKMILPDRRGEGLSSPLTNKLTIKDHALDMKGLLDALGIKEKVTAIGLSYGGPIALTLASIDHRIDEVILMASSPSLDEAKGFSGFLYSHNMLEPVVKIFYKLNLGKKELRYPNFENVYDVESEKDLIKLFTDAIKQTDKKMYESLIFQNASTLDKNNSSITKDISLDIPIYQVIGEQDEIWETDISSYKKRFPNLISTKISGANHKASLIRASEFYEAFLKIYRMEDITT